MRLLVIAILALLLWQYEAQAGALQLSAADSYPYSTPDGKGLADQMVLAALKRAGLEGRLVYAPSERSLVNANEGIVDGEYLRIAGLETSYPNLVMVPEEICDYEFVVFTRRKELRITGWEGLKPYHVGFINGWKLLESNVTGVKSLTKVRNSDSLFNLLLNDRVDLVIMERLSGEAYLRQNNIRDVVSLKPPLARRKMYLYLHQRHRDLVPRLARHLRQIRQDGTAARLAASLLGDK